MFVIRLIEDPVYLKTFALTLTSYECHVLTSTRRENFDFQMHELNMSDRNMTKYFCFSDG